MLFHDRIKNCRSTLLYRVDLQFFIENEQHIGIILIGISVLTK